MRACGREIERSLVEEGFEAGFLEDFGLGDHGIAYDDGDAVDDRGGEGEGEENAFTAETQRAQR